MVLGLFGRFVGLVLFGRGLSGTNNHQGVFVSVFFSNRVLFPFSRFFVVFLSVFGAACFVLFCFRRLFSVFCAAFLFIRKIQVFEASLSVSRHD